MAHPDQQAFCVSVKERFPQFFCGVRVFEVGSRNINGTVRDCFSNCDYVGIDVTAGPGVDVVGLAHQYESPPNSFDVVCALETFEHDPHVEKTIARMLELLRPDGLFFMTCAGERRREHGTRRTGNCYGPDPNFYRNVSVAEFLNWLNPRHFQFSELFIQHNAKAADLYCYAIKAK